MSADSDTDVYFWQTGAHVDRAEEPDGEVLKHLQHFHIFWFLYVMHLRLGST